MPLRLLIAILLALPAMRAAAEPPGGRAELRVGIGSRDDTIDLARARDAASGTAIDLDARAAWFPSNGILGIAAGLRGTRFDLERERGQYSPDRLTMNALDAGAGLALRARARWLGLEGHLGYGLRQLPAVQVSAGPAGDTRLSAGSVRGHGPAVGARLVAALGARLGLELEGEATPWLLGAHYAGTAVRPHAFALGAALRGDLATTTRLRWSALLGCEWARSTASGDGVALAQRAQEIVAGVRGTWLPAPPPTVAAPVPAPVPAPAIAVIGGVVRAEGEAVAARITVPELGLETAVDARGGFRFEVPPGPYTLIIEAPGLVPQRKAVTASAGERHIYDIELQREAP